MNTKLTLSPLETFLGTETHLLLRADVQDEIENGRTPATTKEFQARRPEYMQMSTTQFGQRLRQERRYRKYCIHLNEKREAKAYEDPRGEPDRRPLDSPDQEDHDKEDEERKQDEERGDAKKKRRKKHN